MQRPNIMLVIARDCGRHFGCYWADVATPNIDRIGREGVLFENAFGVGSGAGLDQLSASTGRADQPLAGLLAELGYHTIHFGQLGVGRQAHDGRTVAGMSWPEAGHAHAKTAGVGMAPSQPPDPSCGFRRVVAADSDGTMRAVLPHVEQFLAAAPGQPFFATVRFRECAPPRDTIRYPMDNPDDVIVPLWVPDTAAMRTEVAQLNGAIRGVDEAVGRIDAGLTGAGVAGNTVLVFTTDGGPAIPNCPGGKGTLLDSGLGVAMVARLGAECQMPNAECQMPNAKRQVANAECPAPGARPAIQQVCRQQLVSTADLAPTLLELAGYHGHDARGRSLLPLISAASGQPGQPWRDCLIVEQGGDVCVRTERFKLIARPGRGNQLFDLATDPDERRSLAGDPRHAATLAELRGKLSAVSTQHSAKMLIAES